MTHHHHRQNNHPYVGSGERLLSPEPPTYQGGSPATPEKTESPASARYVFRAVILLLLPLAVTGYFCFIWLRFLRPGSAIKYGIDGGRQIFYSWWVISILALDWSRYGLLGAEAFMLRHPWFRVPHMVGLLNHSESSWSGLGGWLDAFSRFVNTDDLDAGRIGWRGFTQSLWLIAINPMKWGTVLVRLFKSFRTYKLWYTLAFISLMPYVGLALSGLSMELFDGYTRLDEHPMVVGCRPDTLHSKIYTRYQRAIKQMWEAGSPASIPGFGIVYTPDYVKRHDYDGLEGSSNTLPSTKGIPDMFMAPQAQLPVSGRTWGLRASYNCTIVKNKSEFTLLSQELDSCSTEPDKGKPCIDKFVSGSDSDSNSVEAALYSQTLGAYIEVAHQFKPGNYGYVTYNGLEPALFDADGVSQGDTIEYALWQVRKEDAYKKDKGFDGTIEPTIPDMGSPFAKADNGSWVYNTEYLSHRWGKSGSTTLEQVQSEILNMLSGQEVMESTAAIGVRCVSISTTGDASLDARTSTFYSFEQAPPQDWQKNPNEPEAPVSRLGVETAQILASSYLRIFSSINSRSMTPSSNSVYYSKYVTPQDLQKSVMLLYAMEALQIMYDGKYGFEGSWRNENLTSSKKDKVLGRGETVPPEVSLGILGVWAITSVVLAVTFAFRSRPVGSLDGLSFFRLGVYLAPELEDEPKLYSAKEAYEVRKLGELPGMSSGVSEKCGLF